jgi:hypothetical protein
MTEKEYRSARRAAKKTISGVSLRSQRALHKLFVISGKIVSQKIRTYPNGFELTKERRADIADLINKESLRKAVNKAVGESSRESMKILSDIDAKYVQEAVSEAKIKDIDDEGIIKTFDRMIDRILKDTVPKNQATRYVVKNRTGYNLSDVIWSSLEDFQEKIFNYVEAGIKQGLDPKKIANGLMLYLDGDAETIRGAWGILQPGTAAYINRLGKAGVDYRTQRVVRTEMYNNIRKSDIQTGKMNPGATDTFNWKLSPSRQQWNCDCPDRAANGPYSETIARGLIDTAHPNCFCMIEPVMKDHEQFMRDLEDYRDGVESAGAHEIERWKDLYYAA